MNPWFWVGLIVASTTAGDLLQSREMKLHGAVADLSPRGFSRILAFIVRRHNLLLAVGCMAISFFSFLELLQIADLSFAVPATAATYVVETILARVVLKERLGVRRWLGAGLVAGGVFLLAG